MLRPRGFSAFLILWATQSVSMFGSALTTFAVNVWLAQTLYPGPEQRSELAWALTALSVIEAVVIVVSAPVAGVWVDRHDRRKTMLFLDFASCMFSLILAVLLLINSLNVGLLLVVAAFQFVFRAFHGLAFQASYALLVPAEHLPRANGLMETTFWLSNVLAPGLATVLIAVPHWLRTTGGPTPLLFLGQLSNGVPLAAAVDALTFVVAALALGQVVLPPIIRVAPEKRSVWAEAKEGLDFLWRHKPLLWLSIVFTISNFGIPLEMFFLLIVKSNLAPDWVARGFTYESALALIFTVNNLGGIVGGVSMSAWGGLKSKRVFGVLIALCISSLAQIAFGLSLGLYLSAAAAFVIAACVPVMNGPFNRPRFQLNCRGAYLVFPVSGSIDVAGRHSAVGRVGRFCGSGSVDGCGRVGIFCVQNGDVL